MQYSLKFSFSFFIRYVLSIVGTLLLFSTTSFAEETAKEQLEAAQHSQTQENEQTIKPEPITFSAAVNALIIKSFKKKSVAIDALVEIKDQRSLAILQAMLAGTLYYQKEDKTIVFAIKKQGKYEITNAISSQLIGLTEKRNIKKIRVNNKLRKQLRKNIAILNLSSEYPDVRLQAVDDMLQSTSPESVVILRELEGKESNNKVRDAMLLAIALADTYSDDKFTVITAINTLKDSVEPIVLNRFNTFLEKSSEGIYTTKDDDIRKAAKSAIKSIKTKLDFYQTIETVFFGLSLGSVLLLAAIGLAITFGVMGVINMAHGELIMLGAYTTYVVQLLMPNNIEISIFVAVPAAFIVTFLFGVAIERGVIRFLYGRPLETLLATFGISLILQQLVRSVFSPLNRSVETPQWMSGTLEINAILGFTYNRVYILIFCLLVFFALMLILKKTSLGLKVRAVSQNRQMAKAMGVRTEWVDAMTFGLGSGIAGVAGVALSQLTNVGPNMGQAYIIDSFMVVVFGGVGNLWGTLVGAMSLGVVNKFLEPWAGAVLAKILVLVFIILFIQKRPSGIFPHKGRAAES